MAVKHTSHGAGLAAAQAKRMHMLTAIRPTNTAGAVGPCHLTQDTLETVLRSAHHSALVSASEVSHAFRAAAALCWPEKLKDMYGIVSRHSRLRFAQEECWQRGRVRQVALPLPPAAGEGAATPSLAVDALSSSLLHVSGDAASRFQMPREASSLNAAHFVDNPNEAAQDGATASYLQPVRADVHHRRQSHGGTSATAACIGTAAWGAAWGGVELMQPGTPARRHDADAPRRAHVKAPAASPLAGASGLMSALLVAPLEGDTSGFARRPERLLVATGTQGGELRTCAVDMRAAAIDDAMADDPHHASDVEVVVADGSAAALIGTSGGGLCTPHAGTRVSALAFDRATPRPDQLVMGSGGGHVELVDVPRGCVVGSALSSCACPPCAVVYDRGHRLLGCARRHGFTGSGHGHTVQLFDSRSMERIVDLWPGSDGRPGRSRGERGEEVIGIHCDGRRLVACSAHGLVCTWDVRHAQRGPLLCTSLDVRTADGRREPLGAMHADGEWLAAAHEHAAAAAPLRLLSVAAPCR